MAVAAGYAAVGAPDAEGGAGAVYVFTGPLSGVLQASTAASYSGLTGEALGSSVAVAPGRGWLFAAAPLGGADEQGTLYTLVLP